MALEVLEHGLMSHKSDVWSFGVTLWELFSLGQIPYITLDMDETFPMKLKNGLRLEQPKFSTYDLLVLCIIIIIINVCVK